MTMLRAAPFFRHAMLAGMWPCPLLFYLTSAMLRHTRLEDLIEGMCSSANSRVGLCFHSMKDQSNKLIRATSI